MACTRVVRGRVLKFRCMLKRLGATMKRILVGMLVATVCCGASAMTLQTYRKLQQSAELAGSEASYRNLEVLTALKVGIAGTVESLRSSDGSVRVNGKSLICAPPSVPITQREQTT